MRAASSISAGTPSKALRSRIMLVAFIPMAITTTHFRSMEYMGSVVLPSPAVPKMAAKIFAVSR